MNIKLKRTVALLSAFAMAMTIVGCDKKTDDSDDSGSKIKREKITTAPVVETMGDLDLSDVQYENNVAEDFSYMREAEDGKLGGGASALDKKFLGDFSGKGFVALFAADDTVTFDVELDVDGSYDITVMCAADSETAQDIITVDGNPLVAFDITSKKFAENVAEKVIIPKGKHTIGIKSNGEIVGTYIDYLKITKAEPVDLTQYEVSNKLCNPNASEETQRLYNFLTDVYGKYTISGQYPANNQGKDGRELKEIKRVTGKTPAILGLDLIESSPSRIAHGAGGGQMVPLQAMDWWNNEGGIVTLCWHWNAPDKYLGKNGKPWFQGFNADATTFDLAAALDGSDPEGYDLLISDIDAIAEILAKLDDNHVPVLWRPLHEGGGDRKWNNPWFWWGASGSEAYKELWKLMYDRLTNYHHINNLIWVWNGQVKSYYPGDEYVDILGYDIYAEKHDSSSQKKTYDYTKDTTETKKIVALTENGALFDPDAAFNDGTRWAWFATWSSGTNEEEDACFTLKDAQLSDVFTTIDMWKKVYNSERVLTLDELPDLKNYPLDTEKYLAENKK